LSNILLDDLDKELERRGHRFYRYADDVNVYVGSRRAGQRVLDSIEKLLARRLHLRVNRQKSAVDRPWKRKFFDRLGLVSLLDSVLKFQCNS
jgi:retron-type reverse transcriptase